MTEAEKRVLHIYGQYVWHDDVQICGTREALTLLRETIDSALSGEGVTSAEPFFCTDGEGYGVTVYVTEGWQMPIQEMPYSADYAQ